MRPTSKKTAFTHWDGDAFGSRYATVNYGIMYTAKGCAALLVPLGNVLTHYTGSWHAVYAVGCAMNAVAALLGFFVPNR
jgi:MFS transporter, OFA family, oxalate/formate antiporter